jgi:hypothetical protein
MRRHVTIVPDLQLIIDAQLLSDGASVHQLSQDITIYQCTAHLFNSTGDETWKILFERMETKLRAFVAKAKLKKFDTNAPPEFLIGSSPTGSPGEAL